MIQMCTQLFFPTNTDLVRIQNTHKESIQNALCIYHLDPCQINCIQQVTFLQGSIPFQKQKECWLAQGCFFSTHI